MGKRVRAARAAKKTPGQAPNPPAASPASDPTASTPDPVEEIEELENNIALITPAVLKYLRGELARAEATVKHGPNGQGWRFSESLKPAADEVATFLSRLVPSLEAAVAE